MRHRNLITGAVLAVFLALAGVQNAAATSTLEPGFDFRSLFSGSGIFDPIDPVVLDTPADVLPPGEFDPFPPGSPPAPPAFHGSSAAVGPLDPDPDMLASGLVSQASSGSSVDWTAVGTASGEVTPDGFFPDLVGKTSNISLFSIGFTLDSFYTIDLTADLFAGLSGPPGGGLPPESFAAVGLFAGLLMPDDLDAAPDLSGAVNRRSRPLWASPFRRLGPAGTGLLHSRCCCLGRPRRRRIPSSDLWCVQFRSHIRTHRGNSSRPRTGQFAAAGYWSCGPGRLPKAQDVLSRIR